MIASRSWLISVCTIFGIISLAVGKVPEDDLFPFGIQNGDSLVPASGSGAAAGPIDLQGEQFVFSNYIYYSVYVNTNGIITFNAPIPSGTPLCRDHYYRTISIFPYWAGIDTSQGLGGAVYYRQSHDENLKKKAAQEIRAANPFIALSAEDVQWLFVITWYQAPFAGAAACGHTNATVPRNTFQAVLVSCGDRRFCSFAIFYYSDITWTSGNNASGDCSGLGGVGARAGFESQDVYSIYDIPSSCDSGNVVNIDETSNYNSPGKWVLRVDAPVDMDRQNSPMEDGEESSKGDRKQRKPAGNFKLNRQ